MAAENDKKFCRFFMVGYCKFNDKCKFKHVMEVCSIKSCQKKTCFKRHPKNCKFSFLRNFCKFKEDCKYSHDTTDNEKEMILQEVGRLKLENEILKTGNRDLENEALRLKKVLEEVKKELNLVYGVNHHLYKDQDM